MVSRPRQCEDFLADWVVPGCAPCADLGNDCCVVRLALLLPIHVVEAMVIMLTAVAPKVVRIC